MAYTLEEFKKNFKTAYLADEYSTLEKEKIEVDALIESDPSMTELAQDDVVRIKTRTEELWNQMNQILDKDKEEEEIPKVIIMEIAAGAGGDESSLFALDLVTMYTGFAEIKGWQTDIVVIAMPP